MSNGLFKCAVVLVLLVGCTHPKGDIASATADKATSSVAELPVDDHRQSKPDLTSKPAESTSKGEVISTLNRLDEIIPRPIETEEDAKVCIAAATSFSDRMESITGLADDSQTKRLTDCVVQYDVVDGGSTKYFPDGEKIRLTFRSNGEADLNIFVPKLELDGSALHLHFKETSIWITGRSGDKLENAVLIRSDITDAFRRGQGWETIRDADRLETYALKFYEEFESRQRKR